jgi:hypothetical protein
MNEAFEFVNKLWNKLIRAFYMLPSMVLPTSNTDNHGKVEGDNVVVAYLVYVRQRCINCVL